MVNIVWQSIEDAVVANEFLLRFELLLAVALLFPALVLALLAALHKEIIFWRYASAGMLFISFAAALSAAGNLTPTAELTLASHLLCIFGYYLCSKSIRRIYNFRKWPWLEEAGILVFSIAFALVIWQSSTYGHLAAALSLCIMYFLAIWGLVAIQSWRDEKSFATAIIITLSIMYGIVTALRTLAALRINGLVFSLPYWDQIFIMTSLVVTFLFALAQFMHGNDLIQRRNVQRLQDVTTYLAKERELTSKLLKANNEQQNLQKLLLHEFKRPLSALHAALQVDDITKRSVSAKKLERLRMLTRQATAYLEGISQFQDVSELFEAPNWSLVRLSEIAKDIETKWGVEVEVDDQLAAQALLCDPLLLDIAIGNLIENAKKFSQTPTGVSMRLEHFDNRLRLGVQDDGPGIPNTEWEHIWQKFYKLDRETTNALTGCGLGLYVVEQVAKVHSGHANVFSEKPSVVGLELPLAARSSANE